MSHFQKTLCRSFALLISITFFPISGPASADSTASDTKLRAGDVVQIVLPGETSFAKPFQLDAIGNVTIPEIGVVALNGLTLAAGRDRLRDRWEVVLRDL